MPRGLLWIASVVAIGFVAGSAPAEERETPPPRPPPPPREAPHRENFERQRAREIDEIRERLNDLDRRRDELIGEEKLSEDDPRVREVAEEMELLHRELAELSREGHRPEHEGFRPPGPIVEGPPRPQPRPPSPELLKKLEAVVPEIEFDNVPFEKVIDALRERQKINILVDWRALEELGVDRDTPISVTLTKVSFETVVKMVLRTASPDPGMLGSFADGSVLVVTTWEGMPRPVFRPPPVEEIMERLRRVRPEVHERLTDLRREDPERFRQELAEIMRTASRLDQEARERRELEALRRDDPERFKMVERDNELTDRTVALAEQVRRTREEGQKGKLRNELRKLLNEQFDLRMQARRLEAKELKARLDELTATLDRRARNKVALVEQRMTQLLHPEEIEW